MTRPTDFETIEKKARLRSRSIKTITYALLAIWAIVVLFPFY